MFLKLFKKHEPEKSPEDELFDEVSKMAGESTLRLNTTMKELEQVTNRVVRMIEKKKLVSGK